MTQQARNVTSDLEDTDLVTKFLIRERDTKYTASFDQVKGTNISINPLTWGDARQI